MIVELSNKLARDPRLKKEGSLSPEISVKVDCHMLSAAQSYFAGRLAACLPARRPENMQSEIEMPLAK